MSVRSLASVLLLLAVSVSGVSALTCYYGIVGANIITKSCASGLFCATYPQGPATTLGCISAAPESGQTDVTTCESADTVCCEYDYCNSPNGTSAAPTSGTYVATAFASVRTLVYAQSVWQYDDSGDDLGSAWLGSSPDYSTFVNGRGPFGYDTTLAKGFQPYVNTVLNATTKAITTYFVQQVPALNVTITKAVVRLLCNVGAVIYVNGQEIYSTNMVGGVTSSSYAAQYGSEPADYYYTIPITQTSMFNANQSNIVQVEVHTVSGNTALTFDAKVLIYTDDTTNAFPLLTTLIAKGSVWNFAGSASANWANGNFINFATSVAPLGANMPANINLGTVLAPQQLTSTIYLVYTIGSIVNTANELVLNILAQDGFIVYLNGAEILRNNMPAVNATLLPALSDMSYQTSTGTYRSYGGLSLASRTNGNQILAVEVHRAASATSSTPFIFDLEALIVVPQEFCQSFDVVASVPAVNATTFPNNYAYPLASCVFPFTFNGTAQTDCISTPDKPNGTWCGTTSNVDIDQSWGYCNPCVYQSQCLSAYVINDGTFTGCIQTADPYDDYMLPWCLTTSGLAYCGGPVPATSAPTDTNPTPSPTGGGTSTNQTAIIGGIVGGVVGALIIALIIILLVWYKRSKKQEDKMAAMLAASLNNSANTTAITQSALPAGFGGGFSSSTQYTMNNTSITRTHQSGSSGGSSGTPTSAGYSSAGNTKASNISSGTASYRGDFQGRMASVPIPSSNYGGAVGGTEMTVLNTQLEKSLPGFLMLNDLQSQIRLGRVINAGAAGTLYEGYIVDPVLRQRAGEEVVAVKTVQYPNHTREQALEAFHHEITAMWSLSFHPNVVKLIAFDDATTSMVQPLYDGDLDHFLHKNPNRLPNDDLSRLHVIVCICKGMTEIHNLGIVHRDLKCANILLRWLPGFDLPEVVIIDFGIARIAENHKVAGRREFDMFGLSPRYAAPEAFARYYMKDPEEQSTEQQKKSDVYSFGVMVWEVLVRKIPWDGMTAEQIQMNVRSGVTLPQPTASSDLVPNAMTVLWRACTQMEPMNRPSFNVIVDKLGAVVREFNNLMLKSQYDQQRR